MAAFERKKSKPRRGERGVALAITLMIMTVMCLIGAAALMTSSIDLRITGNAQVQKRAFYLADAGLNYARINPPTAWANINNPQAPASFSNKTKDEKSQTGIDGNFEGRITYQRVTDPPKGSGTGIRSGRAYHFLLECTGLGENQAQVQAQMRGFVIGK